MSNITSNITSKTSSNSIHNIAENTTLHSNSENPMSQVSMRNGYWFYFNHNGNDISVHGSAWSGKETIYLNNHPVSIKRNFGRTGKHYFAHNGVNYEVIYELKSWTSGELESTLIADGEVIGSEKVAYYPEGDSKGKWFTHSATIFGFFVGGLIGGYFTYILLDALFG